MVTVSVLAVVELEIVLEDRVETTTEGGTI
jgi:hypothetical protein